MQTEIEAKFTDIDLEVMRECLMRRINFDWASDRLDEQRAWVRVRDEGDKVTMTYKRVLDRTLHGTKEVNLTVDGFDSACQFLEAIGMVKRVLQETKRETWEFRGCEITLDTWPWVPPFIEIEGATEEAVRAAAHALELPWERAMHGSVETVYQQHFDITEREFDHWPSISFIPVPDWLEVKRR